MDIYEQIVQLRREGRRGAVATIVNVRGSIPSFQTAKMLVRDDGSIVGTIGGGCVEADVWQAAREVMESEKPRTLNFRLEPGSEVRHRAGLRRHAGGFCRAGAASSVTLYFRRRSCGLQSLQGPRRRRIRRDRDRRSLFLRHPGAISRRPAKCMRSISIEAMRTLDPNEASYIVIVTRGHRDDMRILRWAVQTRARYVGMIGSKRKVIEIFKALQKEGLPAHLFDRVHSPIGLDIGAVTPEEIAVAITAELIAIRRHATAALPHMSWFKTKSDAADQIDRPTRVTVKPETTKDTKVA